MPTDPKHAEGMIFERDDILEHRVRSWGFPPDPRLSPYVQAYWMMTWDLPDMVSYPSLVLPSGCVNLVFTAKGAVATGVRHEAQSSALSGRGDMVGVLFSPGGFHPFLKKPVSRITDGFIGLEDLLGSNTGALEVEVRNATEDCQRASVLNHILLARSPAVPPVELGIVSEIAGFIIENEQVVATSQVLEQFTINERKLQRLFDRYVGISVKTLIRIKRFQTAIKQMMTGIPVDWADLSLRLGYVDQSHFINDFKKITGRSPAGFDVASL